MRLIDADALKAELKMSDKCDNCVLNGRCDTPIYKSDLCNLLDDAPTVSNWISVKDRMPEEKQGRFEGEMESDFVLCYAESEDEAIIDIGYTVNGEWECESGYVNDYCEVTHWMPFPEAPKGV